jgi:hypothetical protein
MAEQSKSPDARARWLTVAQAALDRSRDADDWNSSTTERDVLSVLALGGSVP